MSAVSTEDLILRLVTELVVRRDVNRVSTMVPVAPRATVLLGF
jgi:hypothetical protein